MDNPAVFRLCNFRYSQAIFRAITPAQRQPSGVVDLTAAGGIERGFPQDDGRARFGRKSRDVLDHRIEFVHFSAVVIKTFGHNESGAPQAKKSGTGAPLHTKEPVTVASFRTWRVWRENVARNRCLTLHTIKRWSKTGIAMEAHYRRDAACRVSTPAALGAFQLSSRYG